MPVVVDHEQRREEVMEIAIDLIAEGGIERASVRAIAERAGYSTAIVSHYFHDKAELLLLAFERTIEQARQRAEEAIANGPSSLGALEVFLPIDPAAIRSWKIWFAFWGMALSDTKHRRAQIKRSRQGQEIVRQVLEHYGEVPEQAAGGREEQARRLFAMIGGIAILATFDPGAWPAPQQRAMLAAELEGLKRG